MCIPIRISVKTFSVSRITCGRFVVLRCYFVIFSLSFSEILFETQRIFSETPMRKSSFEYAFEDGDVIDDQKVPPEMTRTKPGKGNDWCFR